MSKITQQTRIWSGVFGKEYTDRNALCLEDLQSLYRRRYGTSRTEMNRQFFSVLDPSARILEVGSNIGNQLLLLGEMGFSDLWGIELQSYAVELSKLRAPNLNIIQGSVVDIPCKDSYFDLVFTSGLLIHIHPDDLAEAMREIHRCAKKYIWGFECYAPESTEVVYRQLKNLLWRGDFVKSYLEFFEDFELVKEERYKYLDSDNVDSMFLLRRKVE